MADATQAKVVYKKWNGTGFEDAYVGADSGVSYTLITNSGDADWYAGYYVVGADFDDGTGTGTPDGIIDAKDAEYAKTNSLSTTFTISEGAIVSGDVKLILVDGFTLNVTGATNNAGIIVCNPGSDFFTVYGQENGTGTLNATGGYGGAGIGSGSGDDGSNITINGGIVTAEGNGDAAGIGGGYFGNGSNIKINGGTVTATGGENDVSGIGGGFCGDGSKIYVSTDLVVKAGNINPPTKEIFHTSDEDISDKLDEKQYVTVEKLSGYKLETYGKWGTGAVGGGGVTFTVDSKEVTRAEENDVVTIAPIELQNYYCAGASSTDVTITNDQFTMPAREVTVTATYYKLVSERKVIDGGTESLGENAAYKDISLDANGCAVSVSEGASATGSNLMFVDNKTAGSSNKGGAIYNDKGTVTINNGATFTGNRAYNGGAIFNDKGTVTIYDGATFTGNTAKGNGGAIYNNASGKTTTATLTIHGGATFTGNIVTTNGGSAIYNNTNSTLTIYDGATFSNNTADNGNGTLFSKGTVTIYDGATFTGNTTNNEGGAIYTYDNSELTINGDATFTDNTTKKNGGAIYNSATLTIDGDATFSNNTVRENNGGAIYSKGTLTITGKATFNGNTADVKGGAIYNEAGTINFSGLMDLQTGTDSWVNLGSYMSAQETFATVNWDLTGGQEKYGSINNFQRYSNLTTKVGEIQKYLVTQTITVAAEQEVGEYIIASGDMTGYDTDVSGKYSFTITDGTTPAKTALTVGESVIYNDLKYTLTVSDNDTPEVATDDELVLTVAPSSYALNTQGLWGETPVADGGVTFTVGETPVTRAKEDDVVTIAPIEVAGYYYGGASSKEVTIIDNQFTMPAKDVTVTANYYTLVTERKVITSGEESLGENSAYKDISTTADGGAVSVSEGASATGSNLMFVNNTAAKDKSSKNGGAICNNKGTVTINDGATFTGNTATRSGGAICNTQGTVTINGDATFSGNTASSNYNGGAICNTQGTVTINDGATFINNTGYDGGAIYNKEGTVTINGDAIFSGNTASHNGGAIYNWNATINFAGEITLATASDIIRNFGSTPTATTTVNWDLSLGTEQYGSIRNFQRYENASIGYVGYYVNQFITVAAEQEVGEYIIASGDMTGYDTDVSGKYSFTITDGTTPAKTALTVGESVIYNDLKYTLSVSDNDTPEVATDDELVLTVAEPPVCTLTSASNQTWGGVTFRVGETPVTDAKEGETVTVTAQNAEEGYVFVNFTSDEVVITDGSFTMPAEAVTVTANYYKAAVADDTTNKYLEGKDTEIISGETAVMTYGGTSNESGAELAGSYSIIIANSEDPAHYGESFAAGDKVKSCEVSREGSISLTIEGGTFDKRVAGGMYYTENETQTAGSALLADGDVNVTIEGGTFKGRVYGGCNAQNDGLGVYTTIGGSVNLTVDVQNTISFDNHLVAGSRGKGAIKGNTTVTFTGAAGSGEDCLLKFADNSIVFGGSSGDIYKNGQKAETAVEGERNLVFSSYTGDFGAQIMMFSTASFEKETNVNFTDEKLDLWAVDDWSFEAGSTASGLEKNDFTNDTLNFDLTNFDKSSPWTVLSGKDEAFTGFDKIKSVDFGGTAEVKYIEGKGVWSDGTYKLALSSPEEGKKSMILSLAVI